MQGFRLSARTCGSLLLLACVLLSSSADAAYTMNETCQYYPNGYIGDPSNCQGWGYCQNGILAKTGLCSQGFLYDMGKGMCNYAADVQCQTTAQDICNHLTTAQMIPDPNNCQNYCYCNNKAIECASCGSFQAYNPDSSECVWGSKYQCPADSICRLVPNNKFSADPQICGNYIMCVQGSGKSASCKTGLFNPYKGGCDPKYTCSGNGGGTNGNIAPNATVCAVNYNSAMTGTQFFSDNTTCFGYFTCTSNQGPGTWNKCPFGTHFNNDTQKCVTPYTYDCPYDRCGNLNLDFVAANGTECKSYYYCQNQIQSTSTIPCPTAYQYFDEYSQMCVKTKPAQQICNATAPTS